LRLAFVRRHFAERCKQRGDRSLFAEGGDTDGLEGGFIAGGGDLAQDFLFKRCKFGHGFYPAFAGGWLWLREARKVKQKALKSALRRRPLLNPFGRVTTKEIEENQR
jgi:hypothetical protein